MNMIKTRKWADMNAPVSLGKEQMLNKVPQLTIYFWIIKIMATTVGETAADLLAVKLNLGLVVAALVVGLLLLVALFVQLHSRKYVPSIYWVAVVLISIAGTLITDNLVDTFGVPLWVTTVVFAVALCVAFVAWYMLEKSLSVHTIKTTRRELFYWSTILFTFALGTAGGDLLAEGAHLGYLYSGLLFAGSIALVTLLYYKFALNAVVAFWIAYILTRPLGASLGDLLSQPTANGGLGLGTVVTSAAFFVVILALVIFMSERQDDMQPAARAA
ncbi:MAG: hypothetical protein H7306_08835 [Bacteriovorax sp.]|nr:hypothetical protein [Rhizobacter sp.]